MIHTIFVIITTFFALVGIGMAINAFAAWVFPEENICERCGQLSRAHIRRLRRGPRLLIGDRVWRERR